jgi:CubicO group peptidase (beta-lactamase class C family)
LYRPSCPGPFSTSLAATCYLSPWFTLQDSLPSCRLQPWLSSVSSVTPKVRWLPRPRDLQSSDAFQAVLQNLTAILDATFDGKIQAGFDTQNTSISIGIVSFSQPEPDVPVWEYHHLSTENANGTRELSRHSQYLIGSVSKAITVALSVSRSISDLKANMR